MTTAPAGPSDDVLFEDAEDSEEVSAQIDEYDLTSSPNDFNVTTIYNFVESGAVKIPAFQRNYVWDIKRASRLIESLIIGLPVPQIFLYEEERNSFLVVDGQQRLMTIYYFVTGRFPKLSKRAELREIFDKEGSIPKEIRDSNEYFDQFRLKLPEVAEDVANKFAGLTYESLDSYKVQFDLRTIRNIIVKQVRPSGDHSSIYEMFNRLNTGGTLLLPQEIRVSLYHSTFLTRLSKVNLDPRWRELIKQAQPDLHMRDVELLLRVVAIWQQSESYRPSVPTFLNKFAAAWQTASDEDQKRVEDVFDWFFESVDEATAVALRSERGKLVVTLFEAVFAACADQWSQRGAFALPSGFVARLTADEAFRDASDTRPTDRKNVLTRVERAKAILSECLSEA